LEPASLSAVRPAAADGIIPAMPAGTGWTRDEQLVALRLYKRAELAAEGERILLPFLPVVAL